MPDEKFDEDLATLFHRISLKASPENLGKLDVVKSKLVELHHQNLVKINHSAMELVCAYYLILKGYDVTVEQQLDGSLVCDVFGVKGDGRAIVEVETGFIPPEHALDPSAFFTARITSKIARYSSHSNKFMLGVPPHCVLPVRSFFQKPPGRRDTAELKEAKELCDRYYRNPPISLDRIREARLHSVQVIDVDSGSVNEVDPETYIEALDTCAAIIGHPLSPNKKTEEIL